MPNATISQIRVGSTTYDLYDVTARDFISNNFKYVQLTNSSSTTVPAASSAGMVGSFINMHLNKVTDNYAISHNTSLEDINDEGFRCISILSHNYTAHMVMGPKFLWYNGSTYPYPILRLALKTTTAKTYDANAFIAQTLYFKPPSSWSWPTWTTTSS